MCLKYSPQRVCGGGRRRGGEGKGENKEEEKKQKRNAHHEFQHGYTVQSRLCAVLLHPPSGRLQRLHQLLVSATRSHPSKVAGHAKPALLFTQARTNGGSIVQ